MRTVPGLRWFALMVLVAAGAACSPSAAPVGPGGTASPVSIATPSPAPTPTATASPAAASPAITTSPVAAEAAPAVLRVACDGTRTEIPVPVVRAQPDGVHLQFGNTSGTELLYAIEDVGGASVPIAGGSFIYRFAPGRYELTCAADLVAFEVIDPAGFYKPSECADRGSGTTGTRDYTEGATGMRGTPLQVARRQLAGLAPGDSVDLGGYSLAPEALSAPTVVVTRQGVVLAVLTYQSDGKGGWLLETMRTCEGADISLVS